MKIKSLILGSAAALLAVSGARAADAVMAPEPEPVDYVRVCDAYGAGFFYIPGTETCLSINGFVWFKVGGTSQANLGDTPGYSYTPVVKSGVMGPFRDQGWETSARVRINFDARSDTELGTLRGWIRLQADLDNTEAGDGAVGVDQAWIMLGGLAMGYGDSAWNMQINNGALNGGSFTWDGLYYGYQEAQQIRYEFGGKTGLYGLIAVEEPGDEQSWMPNVVARIAYADAWGAVGLTAAYDHDRLDPTTTSRKSSVALAAAARFNLPSMPGSAFKIQGFYNSADSNYGPGSPVASYAGGLIFGQPVWSVLASFIYQATPDLGIIVSGQYFGDHYFKGTKHTVKDVTGDRETAWAAELSAVWTPVKNFEVRPAIVYTKADHLDGTVAGYLRFTRYF